MNVARDLMSVSSEVSKCPTSSSRKRSALQPGHFVDSLLKKAGPRFSIRALMHALLAVILVQASLPLSASAQEAPLMMLPGQFDVTPTGAAAYSIPIAVSPGTGGMVPSLSLEYSSQSGDGIMGLGFSLSGLPSIGRCPRTVAQDGVKGSVNYDTDDRFCLEGQRLTAISGTYGADGTEYRTEIEGFSRVISYGTAGTGPHHFAVWTKSGQVMQFGATDDSRFEAVGTTEVRAWGLNQVTDTVGNYMTVSYTDDQTNGQAYPVRIEYTGNANGGLTPYNAVEFEYNTNRPDVVPKYHAGSLMQTTVLLTNVKTYEGRTYDAQGTVTNTGTLVYDYQITYELPTATSAGGVNRSRVTEIKLCDAAASCLPSTTFTWQGTRDQIALTAQVDPVADGFYPSSRGFVAADFNNDGLIDFGGPQRSQAMEYDEDGEPVGPIPGEYNYSHTTADIYTLGTNGAFIKQPYGIQQHPHIPPDSSCSIDDAEFRFANDHDGDGITDLVVNFISEDDGYCDDQDHRLYKLNPSQNQFEYWTLNNFFFSQELPHAKFFNDMNGDGWSDFLAQGGGLRTPRESYGNGTFNRAVLAGIHMGPHYSGDFDGNGCSDILGMWLTSADVHFYCEPVTTFLDNSAWPTGVQAYTSYTVGDFNGDGKTDVMLTFDDVNGALYLSNGVDFVPTSFAVPVGWNRYHIQAADFNGDGRDDLALISPGGVGWKGSADDHQIYLSTGDGFVQSGTSITNGSNYNNAAIADWTGDGAPDIWMQPTSAIGTQYETTTTLHKLSYTPELVSSVSNGLGITTTFSYDRLNAGTSLYTKLSDATYPQVDIIGPFYVVSQVDSDNGIGGTYSSTYKYEGLKATHEGRGFLGFKRHWVEDPQTGVEQETEFRQDWPYLGLVAQETKRHGAQQLNSTVNTFAADDLGNGRRFVKLTQTDQASNDLNGAAMPSSTTTYQYDAYGNPTQIVVSTSDGSVKTTTNTYKAPDLVKWIHGRLETASVTSTVPDTAYTGNLAPGAGDDELAAQMDTTITFDPRTNDRDPNGDALTITAASGASHGTLTIINGGTEIEYVPAAGYYGTDSFTYTISDGSLTDTATVAVQVIGQNSPPDAVDDSVETGIDSPVTFDPRTNDTDPNAHALLVVNLGSATSGSVEILSGGTEVRYTPNTGFVGSDSFTYTIEDSEGLSDTATVNVSVTNANLPPVANNDNASANENASVTLDPRVNDTDPNNDALMIVSKTDGANGVVAILSGGTQLSYTPDAGFFGTDSFTYGIEDPSGLSATATVAVTIASTNQAPVAANDTVSTDEDVAVTIDPRTNDSDPDSDPLTITAKTDGANGTVAILSGGTQVSYTPNSGFSGTDSFTYTIADPEAATATASVDVTVDAAGILVRDSGGTLTADYQLDTHQITYPIFLFWVTIQELSTSSVVWSSLNVNNPNPPAGWQSNGWKDGFTETGNGQEVIKEGQ